MKVKCLVNWGNESTWDDHWEHNMAFLDSKPWRDIVVDKEYWPQRIFALHELIRIDPVHSQSKSDIPWLFSKFRPSLVNMIPCQIVMCVSHNSLWRFCLFGSMPSHQFGKTASSKHGFQSGNDWEVPHHLQKFTRTTHIFVFYFSDDMYI